jgi:hypothetical protein
MHRLKWEWDSITTFNQFVASFVHPLRSKMSEVLLIDTEEKGAAGVLSRRRLRGDRACAPLAIDIGPGCPPVCDFSRLVGSCPLLVIQHSGISSHPALFYLIYLPTHA